MEFIKYISSKKALFKTDFGFKVKKITQENLPVILSKDEKSLYKRYEYSAKERDYVFELSTTTFKRLIYSNCYYCGKSPQQSHGSILYNGIDRLENDEGYNIDNCLACCKVCNRGKSTLDSTDFMNHCIQVAKHLYPQLNSIIENRPQDAYKLRVEQLHNAGLITRYDVPLEKTTPLIIKYKIEEKSIQDSADEIFFCLKVEQDKLKKQLETR